MTPTFALYFSIFTVTQLAALAHFYSDNVCECRIKDIYLKTSDVLGVFKKEVYLNISVSKTYLGFVDVTYPMAVIDNGNDMFPSHHNPFPCVVIQDHEHSFVFPQKINTQSFYMKNIEGYVYFGGLSFLSVFFACCGLLKLSRDIVKVNTSNQTPGDYEKKDDAPPNPFKTHEQFTFPDGESLTE